MVIYSVCFCCRTVSPELKSYALGVLFLLLRLLGENFYQMKHSFQILWVCLNTHTMAFATVPIKCGGGLPELTATRSDDLRPIRTSIDRRCFVVIFIYFHTDKLDQLYRVRLDDTGKQMHMQEVGGIMELRKSK